MTPGSSGDQPTRVTTATTPTASPAATRAEIRWPKNATAMAAVKSGVAAFRSEVKPAGSVTSAIAMRVNGTAENKAPTTRNVVRRPRAIRSVDGPATRSRTAAPIASRISAAHTGPTSGAAMRRKRNAAPQTAPRKRSEPRSIIESWRRLGAAVLAISRWWRVEVGPRHRRPSSAPPSFDGGPRLRAARGPATLGP